MMYTMTRALQQCMVDGIDDLSTIPQNSGTKDELETTIIWRSNTSVAIENSRLHDLHIA
jgi:hypothetical protein